MDLAVAKELCVLQAGNEAEDSGLLAVLEVVLEADEIVGVGAEDFPGGVGLRHRAICRFWDW